MPRRRILTDERLRELLALPVTEALLIQHWTLSHADLAIVERRRGEPGAVSFCDMPSQPLPCRHVGPYWATVGHSFIPKWRSS